MVEQLESLTLPSGTQMVPTLLLSDTHQTGPSGRSGISPLDGPGATALSPTQIRNAYGINNIVFPGATANGSGQTIAIVDAYDDPSIAQALDTFDAQFGLTASGPSLAQLYGPAATFLTVLNQRGQTSHRRSGAGADERSAHRASCLLKSARAWSD